LVRELLDVEQRFSSMARRAGLFEALEDAIRRNFYEDEADATERALRHRDRLIRARSGEYRQLTLLDGHDLGEGPVTV
jgi:DNA sulfur modification protein DndC